MKPLQIRRVICVAALAVLPVLCGGCRRSEGGSTTAAPAGGIPSVDVVATVPLGQVAGAPAESAAALSTANPYEGNPQAIQQGKQLYVRMNCAGCHAYNGKGNMGPNLTDGAWRYGGLPIQIYKTIHDGRPQGMPAWGAALPPDEIWKLVAYVQSMGGSVSAGNYEHARQGDQPGEQVAPEAEADADQGPAFPVEISPAPDSQPSAAPSKTVPDESSPAASSKPNARPPRQEPAGPQR